jgi:1-deoxy-D-xylulose-5-phosphate synthase
LITALKNVKQLRGPILLHVVTEKGHGYKYAEQDKTKFHGISKFDIETGEKICSDCITYTDAFSRALIKLAKEDEKVVAITAAMASGTGLDKFRQRFPDRFFDVGIAEQHAVTFAAGLASEGFKPVVAIYSTFLQRAYDQIVHDVALQKLPVTFCVDRAGLVGEDGATHHGVFDLSFLRHIPNLTMMAPKDQNELGHMMKTALSLDGPAAIRYPRGAGPSAEIANPYRKISVGKSEVLMDGKDLSIFAVGNMVYGAMNAAKELKKKKINASVVNVRFVKPLDKSLILKLAHKTNNILTVEENALGGGFGSSLIELLEDNKIKANVKRLGIPDRFIEHGNMDILKKKIGLTKENILKEALRIAK